MKRARPKSKSGPLTQPELEAAALRYLDRFDSSHQNLRRVLGRYVEREARERGLDSREALAQVDSLLERYRQSGVLDDARFAGVMAGGLRRRGASRLAIVHKLRARGVSDEIARAALETVDQGRDPQADPELAAALALLRRRRIGPFRPESERVKHARRDLGALARAGFSFDVARRALGLGDEEDA